MKNPLIIALILLLPNVHKAQSTEKKNPLYMYYGVNTNNRTSGTIDSVFASRAYKERIQAPTDRIPIYAEFSRIWTGGCIAHSTDITEYFYSEGESIWLKSGYSEFLTFGDSTFILSFIEDMNKYMLWDSVIVWGEPYYLVSTGDGPTTFTVKLIYDDSTAYNASYTLAPGTSCFQNNCFRRINILKDCYYSVRTHQYLMKDTANIKMYDYYTIIEPDTIAFVHKELDCRSADSLLLRYKSRVSSEYLQPYKCKIDHKAWIATILDSTESVSFRNFLLSKLPRYYYDIAKEFSDQIKDIKNPEEVVKVLDSAYLNYFYQPNK